MNEDRTIKIPSRIIVDSGNTSFEVSPIDSNRLEYLKLCISLGFYEENGVIV